MYLKCLYLVNRPGPGPGLAGSPAPACPPDDLPISRLLGLSSINIVCLQTALRSFLLWLIFLAFAHVGDSSAV